MQYFNASIIIWKYFSSKNTGCQSTIVAVAKYVVTSGFTFQRLIGYPSTSEAQLPRNILCLCYTARSEGVLLPKIIDMPAAAASSNVTFPVQAPDRSRESRLPSGREKIQKEGQAQCGRSDR